MKLFEEWKIRSLTFRNRIGVSPMCQYSCVDGVVNDWHLVHLGSRAVGGAGLVMAEAAGVEARARISPGDAGIYSEAQAAAWAPIAKFIQKEGAVPAIQLAHAGRKASTSVPWLGTGRAGKDAGGWPEDVVGPSPLKYSETYPTPRALTRDEIKSIEEKFLLAAALSLKAGFQVIELHAAHGYLFHEFLSPLTNQRTDEYGGSFENRSRFVCDVARALRKFWPEELPLFTRISATDWVPGGWEIEESLLLARKLKEIGVDLIDVSSGGNLPQQKITLGPGYQVPFCERIRKDAQVATAAVGLITEAHQAQDILDKGQADFIFLARELLRDPYWPRRAAQELGQKITSPKQYERAWNERTH